MFYALDDKMVRVSVRAFTYGGMHAITLPVSCSLPLTFADGDEVPTPVSSWENSHAKYRARCPRLPWSMVWAIGARCPVP